MENRRRWGGLDIWQNIPRKYKAEIAASIFENRGRISDYRKECREYMKSQKTRIPHGWTHAKQVPHYKLCIEVRFDPEKIERWHNKKEVSVYKIEINI